LRKKDWKPRAQKICFLLLDVDGVLTDGRVIYDDTGKEWKFFNIKDGYGIKLVRRAGLRVGILSGRKSASVGVRAKELGIDLVVQKSLDKSKELGKIMQKEKLKPEQICFVGDDLVDIPVFSQVGFAVAVADSVTEAKKSAHYITRQRGGKGAVREVCELILKAQGKWDTVTQKYFSAE
jgi:3-deoxy-D-manno-octulosonate 8-phosphate phosphatase (KDO 8-P phosphatase)